MSKNAMAVQQDSVVASMHRARTALVEANTIQQTKKIIDVAAAAEIYAERQKLGKESIDIAHSIKLEALRKLGEMLKATPKNEGQILRGTKMEPRENEPPTLMELGLDKKTSSIAQKLAELSQNAFDQVREGHETIAKAIAAVNEKKAKKKAAPPENPQDDEPDEQVMLIDALESTVEFLTAENERLSDKNIIDRSPEDRRTEAADLITSLRAENKTLKINYDAVIKSRDALLNENASLKKQCKINEARIKKLTDAGKK